MFHFAAATVNRAITSPGEFFKCFSPFQATDFPDAKLYGVLIALPYKETAYEDFQYDIFWQGGSIFLAPQTFDVSSSTILELLDIDMTLNGNPATIETFEEISFLAVTLPVGGIPAGTKCVAIFDDGIEGGGGVTDHGALTGLADNDHPQYQLAIEKNNAGGYAALDENGLIADNRLPASIARDTEVAAAVTAHEAASNPHPQYLTPAEGDVLYAPIGSGGGSHGVYTPDATPVVPSALDDNFNTGALDVKWTEYQAAFHTLAVNNSHLRLTMASQSSDGINGIFQPIPSGDWIAITKLRHLSPFKAYISAGLMLLEDAVNNPNTSDLMIFQDGRWDQPAADSHLISLARFSDYTTFLSAPFADLVIEKSQMMYQRIDKVGTNYTFYYSYDGIYWFTYGTLAASAFFTPQQIGLFVANTLTAKTAVVMFDYFRLYPAGTTEFGGEI
ncbi:MAG: hypothetical protein MSG64_06335 [Pyrinomonadaceae bacterium MAG19_C2-C3]|nr:hypothetical protein [Pyrinomonadaceae bacterium MAG19_C2-C3]